MPGAVLVRQKQGDISVVYAQGDARGVQENHNNEDKAVAGSSQW